MNAGRFYVEFNITIARFAEFIDLTVTTPLTFIGMMATCSFLLPPDSDIKLDILINLMLTLSVYMTIVSGSFPPTNEIPFVGTYLERSKSFNP